MRARLRLALVIGTVLLGTAACIQPGGNPPGSALYQREREQAPARTNDEVGGAEVYVVVPRGPLVGIAGELPHNDGDADVDVWRVIAGDGQALEIDCGNSAGAITIEVLTGNGAALDTIDCGDPEGAIVSSPTGAYLLRFTTFTGGASSPYEVRIQVPTA